MKGLRRHSPWEKGTDSYCLLLQKYTRTFKEICQMLILLKIARSRRVDRMVKYRTVSDCRKS
jgi:hypothetical protein